MKIESVNRQAWNKATAERCPWVRPVSGETIDRARSGDWAVTLAGPRTVPDHWFGEIENCLILCLGSGGGQQAAVLAAAGAKVTSLDLSDEQVRRDQEVSDEHALGVHCVQGTMTDLDNEGAGDQGLTARYSLPFVEEETLSADEVTQAIARNMMFCRSHTLEDIIGGQTRAGFAITDFVESRRTDARAPGINRLCPTYFATLAVKV